MTTLPHTLLPVATMPLVIGERTVHVPVARPGFLPYSGQAVVDSFGGKDLLLVDGRPRFAEVAILRAFEDAGWEGRWVETYGKAPMRPALWRAWKPGGSSAQEHVPIDTPWVNTQLQAIAQANGGTFGGCWDVVAWKHDRLVFAESKKAKKDRMRGTQLRWLEAALECGCAEEDVLLVEWSM